MYPILESSLRAFMLAVPVSFASLAVAAPPSGLAAFVTEGRTYQGQYTAKNQLLSVNIDGLTYRGNYAANTQEAGAVPDGAPVGKWGRAFLFASSAKVLQCQLDSGFPRVSGRCQGADGRTFDLKSVSPRKGLRRGPQKASLPSS